MTTQESTEISSRARPAAEELLMATDPDSLSVQSQQSIRCKFTDRKTERYFVYYVLSKHNRLNKQDAQLSQRDRAAVCVSFGPKVEDWNWETIFYRHYRSIFNNCDTIFRRLWHKNLD